MNIWNVLKCFVKGGFWRMILVEEEIEVFFEGRKLIIIVYFLDDIFEEIIYDVFIIVVDVVEVFNFFDFNIVVVVMLICYSSLI